MLEQIKALKDRVKHLLETTPRLRDSDVKLIATIWHNESKGVTDKHQFLMNIAHGQYSSSESITRARRKIQEECPELRGRSYSARKGLEIEVRQGINKI